MPQQLLTMGCISSKLIIARSISFHEERKQKPQRTVNGIPLLEDLFTSTSGSDQYLALVRAANTVSNKLHSKSITSNTSSKLATEPDSSQVIEKLEPSGKQGNQFESDHNNRSKSWHNLTGFEDRHDLSSEGDVGNRSFHTVEEYDDMVNRNWLTKSQLVQQSEFNNEELDGSVIKMGLQVSEFGSDTTHHIEDKDSAIKKMQPSCLNKNPALEDREIVKDEVVPSHKTRMLESAAKGVSNIEKGNKRKAIAKRLESLKVPPNIESPAIASLKEWIPADGIYSPGSYVTPKFGSYSLLNTRNANESSEDSIFSPELVSSFEQCMQKLEAEEENILKQIIEIVEEEIDDEKNTDPKINSSNPPYMKV